MSAYATPAQYATYKGLSYPGDWTEAEVARINAGLLQAQGDVDAVIYFSRYDATDTAALETLRDATCARFDYMELSGDDGTGVMGMFDSVGIGSVRLARSSGNATPKQTDPIADKLGPRAAQYLRTGGLISGVVYQA